MPQSQAASTGPSAKTGAGEHSQSAPRTLTAARVQPVIAAPIPVPTLLQPVDAAALGGLNPVQAEAIASNQNEFAARIGGPDQDANNPYYLARWRMAQQLSDQEAELVLGSVFMEHYRSVLAAQEAAQQ